MWPPGSAAAVDRAASISSLLRPAAPPPCPRSPSSPGPAQRGRASLFQAFPPAAPPEMVGGCAPAVPLRHQQAEVPLHPGSPPAACAVCLVFFLPSQRHYLSKNTHEVVSVMSPLGLPGLTHADL